MDRMSFNGLALMFGAVFAFLVTGGALVVATKVF